MITFTHDGRSEQFMEPILGNSNEIEFQRINRHTRAGDLVVFRDADWPVTEKLVLKFDFKTEAELERLQQFVQRSLGDNVTYIDHESIEWFGFIANPSAQAIQPSRNAYQYDVVFEGTQV